MVNDLVGRRCRPRRAGGVRGWVGAETDLCGRTSRGRRCPFERASQKTPVHAENEEHGQDQPCEEREGGECHDVYRGFIHYRPGPSCG
jgi:hypothetical protein